MLSAHFDITMGISLLGCHVVYMLSEIGSVGTDGGNSRLPGMKNS